MKIKEVAKNWLIIICCFFIRNYHLIFNRNRCIKLVIDKHEYIYNDKIRNLGGETLSYLGQSWWLLKNE